jgi:hypothetical protein
VSSRVRRVDSHVRREVSHVRRVDSHVRREVSHVRRVDSHVSLPAPCSLGIVD